MNSILCCYKINYCDFYLHQPFVIMDPKPNLFGGGLGVGGGGLPSDMMYMIMQKLKMSKKLLNSYN